MRRETLILCSVPRFLPCIPVAEWKPQNRRASGGQPSRAASFLSSNRERDLRFPDRIAWFLSSLSWLS